MKMFFLLFLVGFFSLELPAQNFDDVPLPPPAGPGEGNPGTPEPPHSPPPKGPPENGELDPPAGGEPAPSPNDPPPRNGNDVIFTLGSGRTLRGVTKDYIFYPQSDLANIHTLKIIGSYKKTKIEGVRVLYANSSYPKNFGNMAGKLREGEIKLGFPGGYQIKQVVVTATTGGIFSNESGFQLDAIAYVREK